MATVKKTIKKAQTGAKVPKGMIESEMNPGKMIPRSKSNYENGNYTKMLEGNRKAQSKPDGNVKLKQAEMKQKGEKPKGMNFDKKSFDKLPKIKAKAKNGGKFPDLNKDGKVTKADVLKGRGVIAKKGAKVMKKCKYGCK